MGLYDRCRKLYGQFVEKYHGQIPPGIVIVKIAEESGNDPFAVGIDEEMIPCGLSGEAIRRLLDLDIDPFDPEAAVWATCLDLAERRQDLIRRFPHRFDKPSMDLWWSLLLTYSIGVSGAYHVIECVEAYTGVRRGSGHFVGPLRLEVLGWMDATDFYSPAHAQYWSCLKPRTVKRRIIQANGRVDSAISFGSLLPPQFLPGSIPSNDRPKELPSFPDELKVAAEVPFGSSPIQHRRAWLTVVQYAGQRRQRLLTKEAPWWFRIGRYLRGPFRARDKEG